MCGSIINCILVNLMLIHPMLYCVVFTVYIGIFSVLYFHYLRMYVYNRGW
jgi:hypothetical protein